MSIGAIFYLLGVLAALFSLIGLLLGVDERSILIVLLFYGLGGIFGGVALPVFTKG